MNDGNNRVLVLADDFTGANDAGVSLAEAGMSVEVAFTAGQPSTARALILNSDSRAMTAAAATTRVTVAMTAVTSIVMAIARAISAMTAATASVASSPPRRSANIGSRSVRTI